MEILCVDEIVGSSPTEFFLFLFLDLNDLVPSEAPVGCGGGNATLQSHLSGLPAAWRAEVLGGHVNASRGIPGDPEVVWVYDPQPGICFRFGEKKAAFAELCLSVRLRTQDFLPVPDRPDSGASGARNVGQISESLYFPI